MQQRRATSSLSLVLLVYSGWNKVGDLLILGQNVGVLLAQLSTVAKLTFFVQNQMMPRRVFHSDLVQLVLLVRRLA